MAQEDSNPLTNILPVGIFYNSKIYKNFVPKLMRAKELKRLSDRQLRINKPFTWSALALSLGLESIEGEGINSYYEAQVRQGALFSFHPLILEMTTCDNLYALIATHMFSYRSKLRKLLTVTCPKCSNQYVYDFDFSKLVFDNKGGNPKATFDIKMPEGGFLFKGKMAEDLGLANTNYDLYTFRYPTLGDLISLEPYISANTESDFLERMFFKPLVSVRNAKTGQELPPELKNSLNTQLFDLAAPDILALSDAFGAAIPTTSCKNVFQCKKCTNEIEVDVDPNFMFPMAS